MQKRFDKTYDIISNKEICDGYFELKIKAEIGVIKSCRPGQFFMICVPGVFLRRPISIHDAQKGEISFLYKIAGKGTKILSQIKEGEISMLGPLGNGYPQLDLKGTLNRIIIAGGTGIASVHFLAARLKNKGTLYYGAKTKKDLLCLDKFKQLGWKTIISTEDGSKGYKGFITGLLEKKLKSDDCIYVCGPAPMMKAVIKTAKEKCISGYASLEEKMACGVGNCQGCAVKIAGQIKMTCKDGPVFKINDIEL
ncbi:MAG: dihydroorotate dehydrogenase electron transfer subunit [Endomicrobium sp.]|jgi:dihydroorotate dehydrogenase electron transfer subunit|nr:dihydroorotate dehydrogenase electron transfer subunit [Endomicrobium sp.]